jgi:ribonucleoside-diphosphate reductase alpha chain|tara:strand:- start:525 stop:2387 length:1863 start_codon:yes stop_codon:yes gene_type:complete
MELSNEILSDITVHMKYAKYIPELNRRESWDDLVTRNKNMHIKKYPELKENIEEVYRLVYEKKILPSMRSLQFGGKPIEISPNRVYNCAYLPIDHIDSFNEIMFLLLGGTGVGYSVQKHHVEKLEPVNKPYTKRTRRFLVGDSIEGWADAIKVLMKSYMGEKRQSTIEFDFSDIRPKGAQLVTSGGKAPGPQPLKECILKITGILNSKEAGDALSTIEVHDIVCHIADAVLAGGIRRAALISLFSADDDEMIACKSGNWWETNPQRGRANNSACLMRHKITEEFFMDLWKRVELSNAGEPGIYFNNDKDWGTNPCCEIALRPYQFCNLCEVNASDIESQEDLNARVKAAAFIGTLQAGYTDFHYLRDIWRETTEKDALIGVSMTGIGSGVVLGYDMKKAADVVKRENSRVAKLIGIKPAARCTTVKPAGTTSLALGTSSGIHAWHSEYYIRRIRVGKNESIYNYLAQNHPELIEDEYFRPHDTAVISIPQKAPEGAIMRDESPFDLLERIKKVAMEWVVPGHRKGSNTHNVSATVSLKPDQWTFAGRWMWENREHYNGLSVLPYDGGTYTQAPFEDISKSKYEYMMKSLKEIDLKNVTETEDNTDLSGELACAGGACEIT